MKQLLVSIFAVLSMSALAQTPPASHQPHWRTFFVENDGSNHQVDLASVSRPNKTGQFGFVNRVLFARPTIVIDAAEEPAVAIMMRVDGSCVTRHTKIAHDFMVSMDGRRIGIDAMSKKDTMSEPEQGSVHDMMLDLVCGKKVSV